MILSHLIIFLSFLLSYTLSEILPYICYGPDENFPLPYFISASKTISLSGSPSMKVYTFDGKGNTKFSIEQSAMSYSSISAIAQLETSSFILAIGSEKKVHVLNSLTFASTWQDDLSASATLSHISLTVLKDYKVLVSYISNDGQLYIDKYDINSSNLFGKKSITPITQVSSYVSCIETDNVEFIICAYASLIENRIEIFKSDLSTTYRTGIFAGPAASTPYLVYNKIVKLKGDMFIVCALKDSSFECMSGSLINGNISLNLKTIVVFHDCSEQKDQIDLIDYTQDYAYAICKANTGSTGLTLNYAKIEIKNGEIQSTLYTINDPSSKSTISSFKLSQFGSKYMALFSYESDIGNTIRPFDYPNCANMTLLVKSGGYLEFEIKAAIINSISKKDIKQFKFTSFPNSAEFGKLETVNDGKLVDYATLYSTSSFIYRAGTSSNNVTVKYYAIALNGDEGRTCNITFIKSCYKTCKTCNSFGTEDNHECITCKEGEYYKVYDTDNCELIPYSGHFLESKIWYPCQIENCAECLNSITCTECIDFDLADNCQPPPPLPPVCWESCSDCSIEGTQDDHYCEFCRSGYYNKEGESSRNCYAPNLDGYYLNKAEQLIKKCITNCLKCSEDNIFPSSSPSILCDECNNTFSLNSKKDECVNPCDIGISENKICVLACSSSNLVVFEQNCTNCKDLKKYKVGDHCENTIPTHSFVSDSTYNIIAECRPQCLTCEIENTNCTSCKENMYLLGSTCVTEDKCAPFLIADNTKRECVKCNPLYKYENESKCRPKPTNTYVTNQEFHIIADCHEHCKTCAKASDSKGDNCDECNDTRIMHPNKPGTGTCVIKCDLDKQNWYINAYNEYKCTDNEYCTLPDYPYLNTTAYQCLTQCGQNDYVFNFICYKSCPSISIANEADANRNCIEIPNCRMNKANNVTSTQSITELKNIIPSLALNYTNHFKSILYELNWFIADNWNLRIFKLDQCNYDLSYSFLTTDPERGSIPNTFAYFNITECQEKLIKENRLQSLSDVVIAMIDTKQTVAHPHELDYTAYSALTGKQLNIEVCKDITNQITYPIKIDTELMSFAEKMKEKNVDVFNAKDPFFNDLCEPFYNDEGRDVVIDDRRKDYYKDIAFCEEGCDYVRLDYTSTRAECSCETKMVLLENKEGNTTNAFDQFLNEIGLSNHYLGCYRSIFNAEYFAQNYGSWISIVAVITSIGSTVVFFAKGMSPIASFFNNVYTNNNNMIPASNPPPSDVNSNNNNSRNSKATNIRNESNDNLGQSIPCESPSVCSLEINKNEGSKINISSDLAIKEKNETKLNKVKVKSKKKRNSITSAQFGLDNLLYIDALEQDKRSFFLIFLSYIKKTLFGLNLCFNISLFEPLSFKLALFTLNFSLILSLNVAFFTNDFISKRYHSLDELISNEVTQSIIVSIISTIIMFLISPIVSFKTRFLALNKYKDKDITKYKEESAKTLKCFKLTFIIVAVISICLVVFSWYCISTFCAVYPKTQLRWMICTVLTIGFCYVMQLIVTLVMVVLRKISLRLHVSVLYKISQFII